MRSREASCWLAAASMVLRSNCFIAVCCACRCLSSRWCSAISSMRMASSSEIWRDMDPYVLFWELSRNVAGAFKICRRRGILSFLIAIRLAAFDLADDAADKFLAGGARHALDELLVHQRLKRFATAAAVEEMRLEGAFVHLFEEGAEE